MDWRVTKWLCRSSTAAEPIDRILPGEAEQNGHGVAGGLSGMVAKNHGQPAAVSKLQQLS